jgi:hypothetical protein
MPLPFALVRVLSWATSLARLGWGAAGKGLVTLSHHTGVPVAVLAAAGMVLSFRLARRASRLAVEFAIALTLVVFATRLGWIRW